MQNRIPVLVAPAGVALLLGLSAPVRSGGADGPSAQEVQAVLTKAGNFPFPLLSDVHRTAIGAYGVHDADRNVAYRSTFVVDREGVLRWGQAGDREMIRDGTEVLRVLDLIAARRGARSRRPLVRADRGVSSD